MRVAVNKPGSLAQISAAIAACEANIHNLVMRMISPDFHKMIFEIEVRDLAQLTDVLATLKLQRPACPHVQRATMREAGDDLDAGMGRRGRREEEPA